jgi:O-acetyl-ADP-ribose deacetylase (regulator of RNase III)
MGPGGFPEAATRPRVTGRDFPRGKFPMIRLVRGDLLEAETEAVVNAVNTVGIMGKGIALQFQGVFPENYRAYQAACRRHEVQIGRMFVTRRPSHPRWIINFPTKKHWRQKAEIEWVMEGLDDLKRLIQQHGIRSISIPALGCGNGGLPWSTVHREIVARLGELADVDVVVYEPAPC